MVSPSEGNEVRREGRQGVGASHTTVEPGEPSRGTPGREGDAAHEPLERNMTGTPRPETVSTKQQRIAELARNCPDMAFTNLAHHININWLWKAYTLTRKDGAVGVDGQTAEEYETNLVGNLQALLNRAKSGTYVAPPVRRVHIPKAGSPGETRPLGIPTFEDKILQRAVLMVLEPVYETDFLDASHGFRPGRGAHGALQSLWNQAMKLGCGWIVDVDLRKFFDTIDHGHLREFLKRRVRDGVILRLIGKWLNAGVLEEGIHTTPELGAPQGGVLSPLLSNLFLHYVLDQWFEQEVRPRLKGAAFLIRYADDFVIGAAREDDARRIMNVLPKRMSKYGLTVHPEKTRLVRFHPPEVDDSTTLGGGYPGPATFDFLGFTHYWGRSLRGGWVVKQDGERPIPTSGSGPFDMVSTEPAPANRGPTPPPQRKTARPLRVLWNHRELRSPPGIPGAGEESLAPLAVTASPWESYAVARLHSPGTALPTSTGSRGPQRAESRSEGMRRRAGCGNSASPDLRGAWVGNHPGLPGKQRSVRFLNSSATRNRELARTCICHKKLGKGGSSQM